MAKKNDGLRGLGEPILIHVDEHEVRKCLSKLDEFILPGLRDIKQGFDKLRIGPLSGAYLKDILFGGMLAVRKEMMAQIEKETPSRFLRDEAERKSRELLDQVALALERLNDKLDRYVIYDLLEYPSVDDEGNIVLTDEARQAIRDVNSIYVTTPRARELYEAHKAATEALDRFYQMAKGEITSNIVDLAGFFSIDETDRVVSTVRDYECSPYVRDKAAVE